MRENGKTGSKKAMAFGMGFSEIPTLVNGKNRKQTDMVFTNGRTETDTKVNGRTVSNMAKAPTPLLWGTFTPASTNSASLMASANTNGKIKASTQEISSTG